jgi:MinD superfamily P-loop ATPase
MSAAFVSRREFLRGRARPTLFAQVVDQASEKVGADGTEAKVARVDRRRCLAAASQVCTVCAERCGSRAAIRFAGLVPQIDVDRCTGCGECSAGCPAPETAVYLVARATVSP